MAARSFELGLLSDGIENFNGDLDARLAEIAYVAGNDFSAADITAPVTVDFAKP
jgi:hypothetical protein